jgi:hypothetical protein
VEYITWNIKVNSGTAKILLSLSKIISSNIISANLGLCALLQDRLALSLAAFKNEDPPYIRKKEGL